MRKILNSGVQKNTESLCQTDNPETKSKALKNFLKQVSPIKE